MTELLKTPIFDVVELKEVESGFKPIGIKAPDWVSIIVERDEKFLVVSQLRYGIMKPTVEFPSGTVEKDEDPLAAAVRELKEETGIEIAPKDVRLIGTCSPNPAFMMNTKYIYFADLDLVPYSQGEQHLDEHEHIKFSWISKYTLSRGLFRIPDTVPAMFATSLFAYWEYKGLFDALGGMRKCLM